METNSRDFALFIDGIRIERGLSRLDLIDGIISLSQYKRYLRGAASIPNDIVIELADRLRYNVTDFYSLFNKKHSNVYNQLMEIYNVVRGGQYERAFKMCMDFKDELIVSSFNKLIYDFCFIYTQHKLERVSNVHVLSIYSELIDYPNCLTNETFNFIELSTLIQIVIISASLDNYEPANGLYQVLISTNISKNYSGDITILPYIFYNTARIFFTQERFDEALNLINNGISNAKRYETNNNFPHLLLLKSLTLLQLKEKEQALKAIKQCFLHIILLENKSLYDAFKPTYDNNFDIPLNELLGDISDLLYK
jgi:tetratricopeptide (TPR) repeat protein